MEGRGMSVKRYRNYGGVMDPDPEGQWVHVGDMDGDIKEWVLDPALPATPPPSEDVEAAREALQEIASVDAGPDHARAAIEDFEAAIRAEVAAEMPRHKHLTQGCQWCAADMDAEYQRGRAEADESAWHNDGDKCTGIHCGNPEHGYEGEFTDWLVSETTIEALRAALDATPEDAHKP